MKTSTRLFQDPFTSQNPLKFLILAHTLSRLNQSGLVKIYLDSPQFYCVLLSFNQSQVLLKLPVILTKNFIIKKPGFNSFNMILNTQNVQNLHPVLHQIRLYPLK